MSKSSANVCVMAVISVTLVMDAPAPATTTVDVTTAGPVGIATGVLFVAMVVVSIGAAGSVTTSSVQLASEPPSPARSSEMVIVQVPFGFSPRNAASGSSGTSGEATTLLT